MKKSQGAKGNTKRSVLKFLINFICGFYAVTCIFPVVWLGYTSFKTNGQFAANVLALPKYLYLENYVHVVGRTNIPLFMANTLRITICVEIIVLLSSFVTGYFLARFRFRFHTFLSSAYISTLFIPLHAVLVPLYIMMVKTRFLDHWYATMLPMASMEMTTAIFLVRGYVQSLPAEIEEAAAIDGSSFTNTLFKIVLPIVRPVLVTIGIICFFHCWNEFTLSLIAFSKEKLFTLSLAVMRFRGQYISDYPRIMTTIFVAILPALLIYVLFSKQIIKGMMTGAIKG